MIQEINREEQKLIIKRVFKAPVNKVYQAWTDPAELARWYSPNERWRTPEVDLDTVPGGKHNITMRHSDGDKFHNVGRYVEVVQNERISFTWAILEAGMKEGDALITVEFRPVTDGTELTLTMVHHGADSADHLSGASEGWGGCLTMLDNYLVNGVELVAP